MNGTFDAWIVIWRNLSLVSKLAAIYYGRPGIRGTFFVMRDVATAMLLATKLQGALGGAASFFGSWLGSTRQRAPRPRRRRRRQRARHGAHRLRREGPLPLVPRLDRRLAEDVLASCFKEAASHGKGVVLDVHRAARRAA